MRLKSTFVLTLVLFALPSFAAAGTTATFKIVPLVSDQAGMAPNTDPDLVNSWGIAKGRGTPLWVADNGTNKSTVYDRTTGAKQPITVNIPLGAPTGAVYVNSEVTFNVMENGVRGRAMFLFDTETGAIEGWAPSVDTANAIVAVDNSSEGSVYKGLALDHHRQILYAADFHNNRVDTYDRFFTPLHKFTDHNLPKRFAPFNVMVHDKNIYVAFAEREKGGNDEVDGPGLGYIDVFRTNDGSMHNLVANGPLNAPWGMTLAPKEWGPFAGMLVVGNFGDGTINIFDPDTGALITPVLGTDGKPLVIDGVWGLDAGPFGAVTFASGPDHEAHGLTGLIQMVSP